MAQKTRAHAILVLAAAMLLATPAFAQGFGRGGGGHGRGGQGGPGHMGPRLAKVLDLSEAQKAQAQALRGEMREDLAPVREEMRELRQQMRQLWTAETPDRAAILALGQQIDNLQSVIRDRQTELRIEFMGILTAEQQAQIAEHRQGQANRGQQRGRRGPRLNAENEEGQEGRRGPGRRGPRLNAENEEGQEGRRGPGRRGGHGLAQRLGLDEAQQSQAQALRSEMREALESTRQQMQALRQQMRAQWASGQPDIEAIQAIQAEMDTYKTVVREHRVDYHLALHGILTPEQRAQMAEAPRRGQGQGRMNRGRH